MTNLIQNKKLLIIQQLYEEYQRDPDNFPDEQRYLLEEQLKELMDAGMIDGIDEGEESEIDERMKAEGEIKFPAEPLPIKTDDEKAIISRPQEELDVQEIDMKKSSDDKKIRDEDDKQDELLENEEEEISVLYG